MVHTRRATVGLHASAPPQRGQGVDLVNQRVPSTSSTPCSSAVSIRSVHTSGAVHAQRARTAPTGVALGHCRRLVFQQCVGHAFLSLRSSFRCHSRYDFVATTTL